VLERPIAATVGDRFVLRDTSAQRTIGGGRMLDLRAPARKRRTPDRVAQLAAHAVPDAGAALAALLDQPPHHVDLSAFARDRALTARESEAIVVRLGLIEVPTPTTSIALARAALLRLKRALAETLKTFHVDHPDLPGIGLERLRLQLEPRLPATAFRTVLQGLARRGEVALDGAWVRLPGHAVRLTPRDERLWAAVAPLLAGAQRFRPPRVRDLAATTRTPEADVRRLLKLAGRIGKVDEVAHDHFFLRATVAEMVEIAADLARERFKPPRVRDFANAYATPEPQVRKLMRQLARMGRLVEVAPDQFFLRPVVAEMIGVAAGLGADFTAAQFRDRLDNGRKLAILILEFFDRQGITVRRGDLRRTVPQKLQQYGASTPAGGA
jgi:selenocysteine-specific elongation factor